VGIATTYKLNPVIHLPGFFIALSQNARIWPKTLNTSEKLHNSLRNCAHLLLNNSKLTTMKLIKSFLLVAIVAMVAISCGETKKEATEVADDAVEAVEEAADATADAVEEGAEAVEEAVDSLGADAEKAVDSAKVMADATAKKCEGKCSKDGKSCDGSCKA
jgi:hypothetical protein